MDMQDKLFVKHIFTNTIETFNLNNISDGQLLFCFNEYEPIEIYISDNCIYDVIFECLSYYDVDDYSYHICDNNELRLKPGHHYLISDNNNTEDIGYRPSKYNIYISNKSKKYTCQFEVLYNRQLSEEGVGNIILLINNFINGLSIDFFRNAPVNNILSESNHSKFMLYDIISKNITKIQKNCEIIYTKLKSSINGIIKIENFLQKQNYKTIKKNIINVNKYGVYNYKKVLIYDTPENKLLKKYLKNILMIIRNNKVDFQLLIDERILKKNRLKVKLYEIKTYYDNQTVIEVKQQYSNQIISINSQIDECDKWISKFKKWNTDFLIATKTLSRIFESDELKDVSINDHIILTSTFIQNNHYFFFKTLNDLLSSNISSEHIQNNKKYFADKKTYKLFEIFGFIIIQNIIKEFDFEFYDSSIGNIFGFDSGSKFTFIKDDMKVEILYDHHCESIYETQKDFYDTVVNINSKNCKPDYIIKIYNKKRLSNLIIIEIKYRSIKYMIDRNFVTETDKILMDYSQLGYINSDGDKITVQNKVILIYPSKEEKCFKRHHSIFIGINAEKNFNDSIGYNELKNILKIAMS